VTTSPAATLFGWEFPAALSGTLAGFYSPEDEGAYFGITGAAAIVLGLVLFALTPWIRRAMRGVR
jgi:proton-dependent oligopeptide transporter, POT family